MKRILMSLVTIAIVGALITGGTMTYFSDVETIGVHDIQAGTLNLQVGAEDPCIETIHIKNIAPGLYKEPVYKVKNTGSIDGYLWLEFSEITNNDNGCTEPELVAEEKLYGVDNATSGDGEGELGQYLEHRFRREYPDKAWILITSTPLNDLAGTKWFTIDGNPMILHPGDEWGIQLRFTLPEETGNIVQSDSVEFDIIFHLDQVK